MPLRPLIPRLFPGFFLLLLPTLLLARVIFGGDVFLPADLLRDIAPWRAPGQTHFVPWNPLLWDGMAEFYPWRLFAAENLKNGWLPLWNPHELCGTPFVANSQSAIFYPLNLLFVILPVARAFGVSVWIHLALTGIFLYGFLRSGAFRLPRPAALLGAVAWQMSAWQVSWLALPTFLCVSCWLPLALRLTWRAAGSEQREQPRRWAALGVCLGVMILGGHLQIAFYCLSLVCAYALFLLLQSPRPKLTARLLAGIAVGAALAIGLAAPQVLPTLELAHVSHRAGGASWQSYHAYTALALPALNLITLWLPGFYGNPTQGTYWGAVANGGPSAYMENACYVGIFALALAVFGVIATWRASAHTRFFTIASLVALLMALGTPLDTLPYFGLPGFSQSASPGRILVLWTLCASVLAAVGAHKTLEGVARRTGMAAGIVFVLLTVLTVGGTLLWITTDGPRGVLAFNLPRVGDLWRVPLGIFVGAAAVFWLRGRGTLPNAGAGYALAALAAIDLLAAGYGYNHTVPIGDVYPVTPAIAYLQQHVGTDRALILNDRWSLDARRPPNALLPPNDATAYGFHEIAGYDSLLTGQSMRYLAQIDGGRDPAPLENGNMVFTRDYQTQAAEAAGARYVVSPTALPDPALVLTAQQPGMFVYENPRAEPRAQVKGVSATVRDIGPTRVDVQTAAGGTLIVADQWDPGWQAWEGKTAVPMTQGPGMFQSIPLQHGGPQAVELRYQPPTFRFALYLFCLAIAGLSGIGGAALCRRGNRRGGRSAAGV